MIYLLKRLEDSGLVKKIDLSDNLMCSRNHGFQIYVNGIKCILYVRDRPPVKIDYFRDFDNKSCDKWVHDFYNKNVKFIFIYQYNVANKEEYDEIEKNTGIKILPFTYSPSNYKFPIGSLKWEDKNHKWLANGAFKFDNKRPYREIWESAIKGCKEIYCEPENDMKKYLNIIRETKWGLNLRGMMNSPDKFEHLQDGKCYREVEYMSFGMPLAYTYIPTYPFPFFPDDHYLLIKKPEEIENLYHVDPIPFAEKSKNIWDKYFSSKGVTELLLNMVHDSEYREKVIRNINHVASCRLKNQYKMKVID